MSIKLTWSSKENMAEFNSYQAGKVSEGNIVITKLTQQTKHFTKFAVLIEFSWLTQGINFWNSIYRARSANEGI